MSDEVVEGDFAFHGLVHQHRDGISSFPATKSRAQPAPTGDQLERARRKLLACSGHANDAALTPTSVRGLQARPHDIGVASAIKSVVVSKLGRAHLNQHLLDRLVVVLRIYALRAAQLLCDVILLGVRVNSNDFAAVHGLAALNHRQTHGSKAKDDHGGEGVNLRTIPDGAQSSSNTTAKQAHLLQVGLRIDLRAGNFGEDGVFCERGAAHEVVNGRAILLECESGCAIRHDTLALCAADLWAQVGLRAHAEYAVGALALRCVSRDDVVSGFHGQDALSNRLDNGTGLMSQDGRKKALGILATERVDVCVTEGVASKQRKAKRAESSRVQPAI